MTVPAAYRQWQHHARALLEPLAALMQADAADLPISGRPSDHDAPADRLESFARPLLLAAFYLQSEQLDDGNDAVFAGRIAGWFRRGLVLGTQRGTPQFWGPDASYHQHHVEMGLMAIALQLAPATLWTPLLAEEKQQVLAWFATCRGSGIVNNNHLFMSVHLLEFLGTMGQAHRSDRAVINRHLTQLETMHRGGGWFEDGINQAYDHYNAYAFHFYGLMWVRLHGAGDTTRAQRWREWAALFTRDYQYFFAASGEHPAFGRSIAYRFNAINVFGLALSESCTDLAPGMLRRLCTRNLEFFLSRPITQEQGCLAAGFTDRFDAIVEPYSCAASPYWAAKGFTPLLLPSSHPFWQDAELPLPAEGAFVHVMPTPGLVVRSIPGGEIELLNAGSMVGNTQTRYGPWKWSKLAYRTGVHFTYAFPEAIAYSLDSALTAEVDDGRIFGRHSTVALELDSTHIGYSYNLGSKIGQVNTAVETYLWWRGGWILQVHHVEARQPVVLRVGGYALPLTSDEANRVRLTPPLADESAIIIPSVQIPTPMLSAQSSSHSTVLQTLIPMSDHQWDQRLDESCARRHVASPYHVTPVFRSAKIEGPVVLAALAWTGPSGDDAQGWSLQRGAAGTWRLSHPTLGDWAISHPALPALA